MSKRQTSRRLRYVLPGHWFSCDIPICSEVQCPFVSPKREDSELPLLQDRGEPAEAPRAHRAPWRKENRGC